jgi:hypothetical protein
MEGLCAMPESLTVKTVPYENFVETAANNNSWNKQKNRL